MASTGAATCSKALPGEARRLAAAAGVALLIVGPYLVNCYRQFGDPLYAINVHTRFYRASEGSPYGTRMSAVAYTLGKFSDRPITQVDTAIRGLLEYPFALKFGGFRSWPAWVGPAIAWLAAFGLFAWLWSSPGRLALVIVLTSLSPYMLTWVLPSGREWRFTMHAYPFYLVAAAGIVVAVAERLVTFRPAIFSGFITNPRARRRLAIQAITGAALVVGAGIWNRHSPAILARESLVAGLSTSIDTGRRDAVFYRSGWSPLSTTGAVTSRFATTREPVVHIPLPERRPYRFVLRIDPLLPPAGAAAPPIEIWLKSERLGTIAPVLDPSRVGSYEVTIPASLAGDGLTELRFVAGEIRPAGDLAATYAGLRSDTPVGFRLWYVRLEPK